MKHRIECIFEGICHLGEGPLWNVDRKKLYWTDVYNKKIWQFDPNSGASDVFWSGDVMVGGFAFTGRGDVVLCAENSVYLLKNGKRTVMHEIPMQPREIFNDITTDPRGRILAGTVARGDGNGCLLRIEKNKAPVRILEDVYCSNGMTFSLDQKTFFHTNTGKKRVTAYDYDLASGDLSNPRVFFQGAPEQGSPDGLTLDDKDHIWQAFWGASVVRRFSSSGAIVDEIPIPAKQPSSVMFGGENLDQLYITSACQGAADLNTGMSKDGVFLGGKTYRCRVGVRGRPEWPADFD